MKNMNNSIWKVSIGFLLLLFCSINIYAQERTIKGNIKDSYGEAVIGASVMIKGTNIGTASDIDGNYTLKVPSSAKELIITYIGMKDIELPITSDVMNITMEEDTGNLDEVIVIGYGSKTRKDLTGSVGSVSGAKIAAVPVGSAGEALQGKIAGVQVTTVDGAPGADIYIRVRGGTSVTQSNDPLFIVDGFQVNNINDIPPTDIQSIDVLKDASLTAIYGAKGGNGVVIVTTKSAQSGKISINFNSYAQTRTLARKLELLEPYDFVKYQYDNAVTNNSNTYRFRGNFGNPQDFDLYKNVKGTDWQDEIMGSNPISMMYNVTIGGGNENIKFNTSITHHDEKGVLLGSGVRRTNVNLKLNTNISPRLKLLLNPRISYRRDMGAGADNVGNGGIINVLRYRPVNGLRDFSYYPPETVDPDEEKYFALLNPRGDIEQNWRLKHSYTFTNQFSLEWNPINNLILRSEGALSLSFNDDNRFYGYITSEATKNNNLPVAQISKRRGEQYTWVNTANYSFNINENQNLSFLAGSEIQSKQNRDNYNSARYFPKNIKPRKAINNMGLGEAYEVTSSLSSPERTASFFGQANYNYERKYLLSATFRADGSTKFAPGHQWAYFPAISGAWVLSNEEFLEDNNLISNLKIRAAIGSAGNNRIDDDMWRYQYIVQSTKGPSFGETTQNGEQYYLNAGGNTFPNERIK